MLCGEKVTLRPIERDDLRRLHELERNVDLVLLGDGEWQPQPFSVYEKTYEKHLQAEEQVWFVIEADSKVIGSIGLHHCNRFTGTTSFGIGINDPAYVGKGYGREAIALLLDWAFRIQNWRRVWLDTTATNERAIRAYRALGFVEEGRQREHLYTNGSYVDMVVMSVLRREWLARQGENRELRTKNQELRTGDAHGNKGTREQREQENKGTKGTREQGNKRIEI